MSRMCRGCRTVNPPRVRKCQACGGRAFVDATPKKNCVLCGTAFGPLPGRSRKQWETKETCSWDCTVKLRSQRATATRLAKPKQLRLATTPMPREDGTTRLCPVCSLRKPLDEFPRKGSTRKGHTRYAYCKPCSGAYQRRLKLSRLFGLTEDDYDTILEYQGGLCAICGRPPGKVRLHVDHEHSSGLIRGALCWNCNKTLGFWKDDIARFQKAIDYLTNPPAVVALEREVYGRKGRTTSKAPKRKRKAA